MFGSVHRCFTAVMLLTVVPTATAQAPLFGQMDFSTPALPQSVPVAPSTASPPAASPKEPSEPKLRKVDNSIFGAALFQGRFAAESLPVSNPDYLVGPGDVVDIKLWGALDAALQLEVDPQGNIFIPKVGPVAVGNVRANTLNSFVTTRIKRTFRDNVGVYASLAQAVPVKVFVGGNVESPGLYGAWASDSLLHYLDRAGGIDTNRGSFRDIRVLRRGEQRKLVDLYDFLLDGQLPLIQFRDGDTIQVGPVRSTASVDGRVERQQRFEFNETVPLMTLLSWAQVKPEATHVRVVRNSGTAVQAQYLSLSELSTSVDVHAGDQVSVLEDRNSGQIVTEIEGEFQGVSQFVMPYSSNLADLLVSVDTTPLSDLDGAQLYRRSIARRQKEVLEQMLQKLEQAVLSARSGTREEAELRTREADLIMRFIESARDIEPNGQLVLHSGYDPESIFLEDRDRLHIPRVSNTVAVQGEVFFPSAFIHAPGARVKDYLERAGGISHNGSRDNIFLRRPNGEMVQVRDGLFRKVKVYPGDEILVLPKVDAKRFQFSKDLVQIIYQIALSAGVVLRI